MFTTELDEANEIYTDALEQLADASTDLMMTGFSEENAQRKFKLSLEYVKSAKLNLERIRVNG